MEVTDILALRILPTLAIGRLGAADDPMDNYTAEIQDAVKPRKLTPAQTFIVNPATGTIDSDVVPGSVRFKQDGKMRPVAPFLDVWGQFSEDGDLYPLTSAHLEALGLTPAHLQWQVQVGNIKATRRTGSPADSVHAETGVFSDHDRRSLLGHCENFLPGKTIPFGHVQYIRPTPQYPEIRLRFTPAGGYVYGPEPVDGGVDKLLKDIVYDRHKGGWSSYFEPDNGAPPTTTNPGQIYYGKSVSDYGEPPTSGLLSAGYLDDECDGIVQINLDFVSAAGVARKLSAFGRIAAGPPSFAPDSFPIRSVADELEQALFGPVMKEPVDPSEVAEIVRRALETMRLMNTAQMNAASTQRGVGMARMDILDVGRASEPIMDPTVVDSLAMAARHERVLLSLDSGTYSWFAWILRRYTEVGDLSDDGRRKMPAMMRGADSRHLALTRRQVSKVETAADGYQADGARHRRPFTVKDLKPLPPKPKA